MLSNIRILLIKYKTDVNYQLKIMQFVPTTLTLDSGVTRPPPLLAEADLLSCMDKVQKKNPSFNLCYISFVCLFDFPLAPTCRSLSVKNKRPVRVSQCLNHNQHTLFLKICSFIQHFGGSLGDRPRADASSA